MKKHGSAFKLGLALIQTKLGEAMGDPSFRAFKEQHAEENPELLEMVDSSQEKRDRSAKVRAPRIVKVQA